MEFIYIFLGGALGAVLRYLILLCFKVYPADVIGVFGVNMLGCFILGFFSYIGIKRNNILGDDLKKFFTVGFAGGFTTFSAFSHPVLEMFLMHHYLYAFLNMFISVIAGLISVSWGMNCGYYAMLYLIRTKRISLKESR